MKSPLLFTTLSLLLSAAFVLNITAQAVENAPDTTPQADASVAVSKQTNGFEKRLTLQGVSFRVSCPNAGSINRLRIQPEGLKSDNSVIERDIEGTVTNAEVADLNVDGSPELYVYVTSAGSGSYGSLVAYAANKGKSLTEIYLPPIEESKKAAKGYMGHDEFAVVKNSLIRRFPLYKSTDINAAPTGGTRQIQYKLKAGEASWILQPYKTVKY
jgi:hypothetical protein